MGVKSDIWTRMLTERKHRTISVALAILVIIGMIMGIYNATVTIRLKKYKNEIRSAQQYVKEEKYVQAIEAYMGALKINVSDASAISNEIANLYIKIDEYDEAIAILQDCYNKTKDERIYSRVLQLFDVVVEKDYQHKLDLGRRYLLNKEYERAILQFEKANMQKPREVEPVELLLEAYVNQEDFIKANEILKSVKETFDSETLEAFGDIIRNALKEMDYNEILEKADEYYHQDNYETAYDIYKEAIRLIPQSPMAYGKLVEAYMSSEKYDEAIIILQQGIELYKVGELQQLLEGCKVQKANYKKWKKIAQNIFDKMSRGNISELKKIINSKNFEKYRKPDKIIYGTSQSHQNYGVPSADVGIEFYQDGSIYCGEFLNDVRTGSGKFFTRTNDELGYYYYDGEWKNNIPHGIGTVQTMMKVPKGVSKKPCKVIIQGTYSLGYEDGVMIRSIYNHANEIGTLQYRARDGIPQISRESNQERVWEFDHSYVIGYYKIKKQFIECRYIPSSIPEKWGVMDYILKK